jgi:hypothetical protein
LHISFGTRRASPTVGEQRPENLDLEPLKDHLAARTAATATCWARIHDGTHQSDVPGSAATTGVDETLSPEDDRPATRDDRCGAAAAAAACD